MLTADVWMEAGEPSHFLLIKQENKQIKRLPGNVKVIGVISFEEKLGELWLPQRLPKKEKKVI